jgi:hypothetical protein
VSKPRWAATALAGLALAIFGAGGARAASPLSWSAPATIDGSNNLLGVSCPSTSLCVAVDGNGNVVTSTDPAGGGGWTVANVDGANEFDGVSCPSTSLCVAVDAHGNVVTSTNPTGGAVAWSAPTAIDGSNKLWAVSCPSTSLCVAVDAYGNVLTSTDPTAGAGAWTAASADTGNSLKDVSCASTSLCVAVDLAGNVVTSSNPTGGPGAWAVANVDTAQLDSVSCPSTSLCVAGDNAANAITSTNPTGGAGAWTTTHVAGAAALYKSSCPSTSLCAAVDAGGGEVITSTDPTGGAAAWSTETIDSGGSMADVSCPSTSLCVAVDLRGRALVGTPGGGGNAGGGTNTAPDPTVTANVVEGVAGKFTQSGTAVATVNGDADSLGKVASVRVVWGDGQHSDLPHLCSTCGDVDATHQYASAGIYQTTILLTLHDGRTCCAGTGLAEIVPAQTPPISMPTDRRIGVVNFPGFGPGASCTAESLYGVSVIVTAAHCLPNGSPPAQTTFALPDTNPTWYLGGAPTASWCARAADYFPDIPKGAHDYAPDPFADQDPNHPQYGHDYDAPVFIAVSPCAASKSLPAAATAGGLPIDFGPITEGTFRPYGYPARESSGQGRLLTCGPFTDSTVGGALVQGSPCALPVKTQGISGGAVLTKFDGIGGANGLAAVIKGKITGSPPGFAGLPFGSDEMHAYLDAYNDTLTFPGLGQAGMTSRRFSVGRGSTAVTAVRSGTVFRFRLSQRARVTLTIERRATGHFVQRRVHGVRTRSCNRSGRGRRCRLWLQVAKLARGGVAGQNRIPFTGRIRTRALPPGHYRAILQAVDGRHHYSVPARLAFRIV